MSDDLTAFARERFSPMRFRHDDVVTEQQVTSLLEAARLAPSAGNSQPWSFLVGRRGDQTHRRLVRHLARSSSVWAPPAALLVANLSQRYVEDSELEYSEFRQYDLGQAVAHLTFQAHALGLAVHQFRAFDREAVGSEFGLPGHWEVTSMMAVGTPDGPRESHGGSGTSRDRRTVDEIVWQVPAENPLK